MNQSKKFFIYTRKSTDDKDRQVRSIPDQLAELHELAKKEQLEIVDVFVEKQTAKIPGRPVFGEMMSRMEAGEASGILAWHPDRLARNSVDGGKIIYLVDTGVILEMKFPTFWFDPTPQGKFMLSIAFSQSKYYVDNLSENIKRGHRNKLKDGIWPRNAPLGYLNDKVNKVIIPDPLRSPYIVKTFEAYASGKYTLRQIRELVTELGFRSQKEQVLSISNIHDILRNPIFYGLLRYGGEIYEGKHKPIITKKLFDSVQEVMSRKSKPKGKGLKLFLYRGFFRCGECDCFITTETQKGHNYLRCTKRKNPCLQKYIREELITSQITESIKKISLPHDWANWMIEENRKDQSSEIQSNEIFSQKTKDEISLLDSKIEKLMSTYLENALSLEEYRESKNKLVSLKQLLKDKLSAFEKKSHNRFELTEKFLKTNITNMELANEGIPEKILREFKKVGSNFEIKDRTLLFEPRGAWKTLLDSGFGGGGIRNRRRFAPTIFLVQKPFSKVCGGGGIRTPGPRKGSPVFKTGAFNHSATPPYIYFTFLQKPFVFLLFLFSYLLKR